MTWSDRDLDIEKQRMVSTSANNNETLLSWRVLAGTLIVIGIAVAISMIFAS